MPPSTIPSQANTGDGTILPPPAAASPTAAPTAQTDQVAAHNLANTPVAAPPSIMPTAAPAAPAFHFAAPDMPTVSYVDPSQYHDMTALSGAQAAAQTNLLNQQNSLEKNVFGQYQQAIDVQGSALDRYNKLSQQMNLPVYQQQVQTIQGLLSRLTDNINTRANGTEMTQAQRDQLEAVEGKTLRTQLSPLAQAQTAAESNISRMMGFTEQDNQTKLDPIKQYLAGLSGAFGRQMTGLGEANKSGQSALLAKLDQEDKARSAEFARQNSEWDRQFKQQQLDLERQKFSSQNKYNDFMAGIEKQRVAQSAPQAARPGISDAQVNAALTLRSMGGAPDRNYTSPITDAMRPGLNNKANAMPSWIRNWLGM